MVDPNDREFKDIDWGIMKKTRKPNLSDRAPLLNIIQKKKVWRWTENISSTCNGARQAAAEIDRVGKLDIILVLDQANAIKLGLN